MNASRFKFPHAAIRLPSGDVFVAGGAEFPEVFRSKERIFVNVAEGFEAARYFASATLLDDGLAKLPWCFQVQNQLNGGAIAQLHDDSQPDTTGTGERQLEAAAQALRSLTVPGLELSVRPQQITVESSVTSDTRDLWNIVVRQLQDSRLEGLKVVVSKKRPRCGCKPRREK